MCVRVCVCVLICACVFDTDFTGGASQDGYRKLVVSLAFKYRSGLSVTAEQLVCEEPVTGG